MIFVGPFRLRPILVILITAFVTGLAPFLQYQETSESHV